MTLAGKASDARENGSCHIESTDSVVAGMVAQNYTERQVLNCQRSLKQAGFIDLPRGWDVSDTEIDPNASKAAHRFSITPTGMRWWLIRTHGESKYAEMVNAIGGVMQQSSLSADSNLNFQAWADTLGWPLVAVQRVLYAEGLS